MKNFNNYNFSNNEIFSSDINNNNDSFYSLQSYPPNPKIINRKRSRVYVGKNIFHKIKKLQQSQNDTNLKLDIILSIIKSKLLGEYDYTITHYDFYFKNCPKKPDNINENILKNKEDNDYNIKDDFALISSIKKDPFSNTSNVYKKKIQKLHDNKTNSNTLNNPTNLKQKINDILYPDKNEKNNYEENEYNNNMNKKENENTESNNNKDNNNIQDINKDNNNIQKDIKNNNNNYIKNTKTFDEIKTIKNNINSLLFNLNKSFKNEIDLNKYKIETKNNNNTQIKDNINANNNSDNDINNINNNNIFEKELIDINKNCNKIEISEKIDNMDNNNNIIGNDDLENININQEIDNKEIYENKNNINNENDKEYERKLDNSQSDSISVKSLASNTSTKKSNQSSSRKIRGFNFRNNIKIKKYNGSKYDSSTYNPKK